MRMSRDAIARLLARLEAADAMTGAGSWISLARAHRPQPPALLDLPAPPPGPRPGPEASPMRHGLWQAAAWAYARRQAYRRAVRAGRDPLAAVAACGEVGDHGRKPAPGYGGDPGRRPGAPPVPEDVLAHVEALGGLQRCEPETGDMKVQRLLAPLRAAGQFPR